MKEKSYIILGRRKSDNKLFGYTENSFSMSTDSTTNVRVWRIGKHNSEGQTDNYIKREYKYRLNDVKKLNKKHPHIVWKLYRVGSKNCPVKIDWGSYHDVRKSDRRMISSEYRNLAFIKK